MAALRGRAGECGSASVCEGPAKRSQGPGKGAKVPAVGQGSSFLFAFLSRYASPSPFRPAFPPSLPAAGARGFSGVAEQRAAPSSPGGAEAAPGLRILGGRTNGPGGAERDRGGSVRDRGGSVRDRGAPAGPGASRPGLI